jgi:hypothetical protein
MKYMENNFTNIDISDEFQEWILVYTVYVGRLERLIFYGMLLSCLFIVPVFNYVPSHKDVSCGYLNITPWRRLGTSLPI